MGWKFKTLEIMYTVSKYNCITVENLEQFKNRKIIYQATQGSTLEVENAILTLESIVQFHDSFNAIIERFKASKMIERCTEDKATLIFKWLQNFMKENRSIKEVNYIYTKVSLSDLIEVSILLTEEYLNN